MMSKCLKAVNCPHVIGLLHISMSEQFERCTRECVSMSVAEEM